MRKGRVVFAATALLLWFGPVRAEALFLCSSAPALQGGITVLGFEGCINVLDFAEVRYQGERRAEARAWRVSFPATQSFPNWRSHLIEQTEIESLRIHHVISDGFDFSAFLTYRLPNASVVALSAVIEGDQWIERIDLKAQKLERTYNPTPLGGSGQASVTCWDLASNTITEGDCR